MAEAKEKTLEMKEEELSPEEQARKNLARKRFFYLFIILTVAVSILIAWAIVEHLV